MIRPDDCNATSATGSTLEGRADEGPQDPDNGGKRTLRTGRFRIAIARLQPGGGRAARYEFGVVVCDACRPGFDRDFPRHLFVRLGNSASEDVERLCRDGVLAGPHCVRCGIRHE